MRAQLFVSDKFIYGDGAIRQVVIWWVPQPVPPSTHPFKYRLAYVRNGRRIVGFDNERGKGDHVHSLDMEWAYRFQGVPQLLADFTEAVELIRGLMGTEAEATDPPDPQPEPGGSDGRVIDLMAALRASLARKT